MFFSSIKRINRLISKGTSNIYLKLLLRKKWRSQNFDFLSLRSLSPGKFLGSSNSCRYILILKLLFTTYKWEIWEQNCVWLFCHHDSERNYDLLKSKGPCILLNKNITLIKMKRNWKWKIPHTVSYRRTLCFS